ncbi:hypothetical protein Q7P35_008724 [Cladosporium inversicolor]
MAPRLRSAGSTSANDSSIARSGGDSENGSRPASIKSSPPPAKKAAAQEGQPDDDEEENDLPLPGKADKPSASSSQQFERAAHRASRKGLGPSSSSRLSSEYDSEDIVVAPRRSERESTPEPRSSTADDDDLKAPESSSPRDSGNTSNGTGREPNTGSSELSDLGSTPEPADPELVRLAGEERRRKLQLCECDGWCTCERYKIFYGFGPYKKDSDAGSDRSAAHDDDKAAKGTKRKRAPDTDTSPRKKRTAATDTQDEDYDADLGNMSSYQFKDTSDSNNTSLPTAEESDFKLPSQTHLGERVLANEQLPESSMRSTINSGKGSNAFDDKRDTNKIRTEQVYSWDRGDKPMRPPTGWVGGEWIGGRGKGKGKAPLR